MCTVNMSRFNGEPRTAEQDDYLRVLKTSRIPLKDWSEPFRGKFGLQRTEGALKARHTTLGLNSKISNTVPWTDDEEKFHHGTHAFRSRTF
ncbi:hypothetical protein HD806DRAFT_391841 [Xylariaceae sp. AK1471]|nr:hypothetical protein HD806DRAFT_391841 [Xylariaceae sp. AK1471]